MFADLDSRLRKLETAVRFTNPNVDFSTNTPTNPRVGDQFYDTDADLLVYWNGTNWIEIADSNLSVTVQTYTPVWSAPTPPTYSSGALTGRYIKIGKWCFWSVSATLTSVTNFGTGQYTLTVPFAPLQHNAMRDGGLHEGSNHYGLMLDIGPAGGTTGKMYYPGSNGQDQAFNKNSPHNLTTSDFWYISGAYLIA